MFEKDKDLIFACLNRDTAAEYELYNRFAPKMFGICMRYGGNEVEAREILQQGFIRLFSNLRQYDPERSLEPWVRRIFVRTALTYYSKYLKFSREVELTEDAEYAMVQEPVTSAITTNELLAVIQELPVGFRTIFNMYVIENYDHSEIAGMLGISIGTSKSQLNRAKQAIRRKLADRESPYYID